MSAGGHLRQPKAHHGLPNPGDSKKHGKINPKDFKRNDANFLETFKRYYARHVTAKNYIAEKVSRAAA